MSKFRSLIEMLPVKPASEFTLPPMRNEPVRVSRTRTTTSSNPLSSKGFGATVTKGGSSLLKMPRRVSRIRASSSFGYWMICPG